MERLEFDAESFSVDHERRTMTGVVVPWNRVGHKQNGGRWRFNRGSLKFADAKYIRFLEDHNHSLFFGRGISVEETESGLRMTFKVANGEHGDRMLAMAQNGSKTGLSVGVEFDESDTEKDPDNPGVRLVNSAHLVEVSLVKNPAFDEARLISVTASADLGEETGMPEETTETPPAQQPVTFSAEQFSQFLEVVKTNAAPAYPNNQQRQVVDPFANAQVIEPQSYRFDRQGNLQMAKHDFGIDMVRGMNPAFNDKAARDRVEEFLKAQFDVVSTDVNELNPAINLPRYIDQRVYRNPVWDTINKGAPPNGVQPFTWPKFSSASGLVGAHTEGSEPSSGTYVTTNQTVTPAAISGKAKITREVWDMGGMPGIGNLIWRQMTRGWFEALEAKAIAVLDAATPTAIDMSGTPGLADDDLDQALSAAFAGLQFVRGGFTMDNFFTQIDLYKALVAATDSSGRRLYPAIGPQNTNGTVSSRFGSLDINGVTARPSWALAATGTVAASSYLFDSQSVDGWATAPTQLSMPEIEVANVYIGIWGYAATAINDINGVREVIYDPS